MELLLQICKKAKKVYEIPESFIDEMGFLTNQNKEALKEARRGRNILEGYEKLKEKEIRFITCGSREYPEKLTCISDAPYGIFVKGRMPNPALPTVAIIGARQCTEYGRYVATRLGAALAREGIQVISGMARGIDSIAQNAAMEAGGDTFAVLGCGVDVCYPLECASLYEQLGEKGGILSEYPPATQPKAQYFPRRNRIISGLADAIVVVEARERSGTLITVDMALEQGREVYVIPGRITDPLSVGCNKLIRQGAGVIGDFSHFVREVRQLHESQWRVTDKTTEAGQRKRQGQGMDAVLPDAKCVEIGQEEVLSEIQQEIRRILYMEGKSFQQIYTELSEKREVDIATVSSELFQMEIRGRVSVKEGYYHI